MTAATWCRRLFQSVYAQQKTEAKKIAARVRGRAILDGGQKKRTLVIFVKELRYRVCRYVS